MNRFYRATGISKQGFHQWLDQQLHSIEEEKQLLPIVRQLRVAHPRMSARVMYQLLRPTTMGRDKFEQLCYRYGLKIPRPVSYYKTTNSLGVTRFENHLEGRELTGTNQVWVSDITYYRIMDRFYYLTFILDLYSRYIVGYSAAPNLLTSHTTIPALKMALKARKPLPGLILHSDGGGQYYSKHFLKITRAAEIINSMCESVYENAHAERINGTIKNNYLYPYNPRNYDELTHMLKKAVTLYNQQKPHKSLQGVSPLLYEQQLIATNTKTNIFVNLPTT